MHQVGVLLSDLDEARGTGLVDLRRTRLADGTRSLI